MSAEWMEQGTCRGSQDPDAWFSDDPDDIAYATSICERCPVRIQCLDAALTNKEKWGTWGGTHFAGYRPPKQVATLAIRVWASRNGYDIPSTGRLPSAVVQAYKKAVAA